MLACLLIVFREVLEAGIVVGIVMAATQGLARRGLFIGGGIAAGVLGAGVLALFTGAITQALQGFGQEIFNAAILVVAVVMLGWHNLWMASHGRELATQLRSAGNAVLNGEKSLWALAVVITVAVLREGSEIVLFLYGIAASASRQTSGMFAGALVGVGAGAAFGAALYLGLLSIPSSRLFAVTGWLILLLAAGMAAQGAAFLVQADILPALGENVWDTTAFISDDGVLGRVLHALVGYTARPYGIQLLFYVCTLGAILGLMKIVNRSRHTGSVSPARVTAGSAH